MSLRADRRSLGWVRASTLAGVTQRIPYLNARLQGFGATIFAEMSALAQRTNAVNLGQGFPDTDGPSEVSEAAVAAIREGRGNQYPPGTGVPELRHAVADHQKRFYGMTYDQWKSTYQKDATPEQQEAFKKVMADPDLTT